MQLVAALGRPEPAALPLSQAVLDVLAILREGEVRHGVKLESLSLPGHGSGMIDGLPDAQSLLRIARPMHGAPGLQVLRLEVRAGYRSYPGLKAWMAALDGQPLSFRRVWLEDQHLQLVIDVVGA